MPDGGRATPFALQDGPLLGGCRSLVSSPHTGCPQGGQSLEEAHGHPRVRGRRPGRQGGGLCVGLRRNFPWLPPSHTPRCAARLAAFSCSLRPARVPAPAARARSQPAPRPPPDQHLRLHPEPVRRGAGRALLVSESSPQSPPPSLPAPPAGRLPAAGPCQGGTAELPPMPY